MTKAEQRDDFEDEVYLAIRRDLPMMQKDIGDIKVSIEDMQDKAVQSDLKLVKFEATLDNVSSDVKEVKDDLKKLATPVSTPVPWYKEFKSILIVLGLFAFLVQSLAVTNPDVAKALITGIVGIFGSNQTTEVVEES